MGRQVEDKPYLKCSDAAENSSCLGWQEVGLVSIVSAVQELLVQAVDARPLTPDSIHRGRATSE